MGNIVWKERLTLYLDRTLEWKRKEEKKGKENEKERKERKREGEEKKGRRMKRDNLFVYLGGKWKEKGNEIYEIIERKLWNENNIVLFRLENKMVRIKVIFIILIVCILIFSF